MHYRPDGFNEDQNPQNTREYDLRSETSEVILLKKNCGWLISNALKTVCFLLVNTHIPYARKHVALFCGVNEWNCGPK